MQPLDPGRPSIAAERPAGTADAAPPAPLPPDAVALGAELRQNLAGEVRFDAGSRAMYAFDASNYRQPPIGVVTPKSQADVLAAVEICHRHGAPLLARGAGTSLAGQGCNAAVVLDFSRHMNRVLEIDVQSRAATVEPGCVLDDLQSAVRPHRLKFGPDPATHDRCTVGGMIGNNACGIHSVAYGKTVDNVIGLKVLTYDGSVIDLVSPGNADAGGFPRQTHLGRESSDAQPSVASGPAYANANPRVVERHNQIVRDLQALTGRVGDAIRRDFVPIPRRVSGYNLDRLLPEHGFDIAKSLVGSEGTCVVVLEATLKLVGVPGGSALVVLGYPNLITAAEDVPAILEHRPTGLEAMDGGLIRGARETSAGGSLGELLPEGDAWLLVELSGESRDEAAARARDLVRTVGVASASRGSARICADLDEERLIWRLRESGLGASARTDATREVYPGWEDSAVAPADLADYLRDLNALFDRFGYKVMLYGHFGDGCVHCRIPFDLRSPRGIATFREFMQEAASLVGSYGGSLSGEHGDGQARAELLHYMYSEPVLAAFQDFKRIWDPTNRMNPGKLVQPRSPTENLRLGADYRPSHEATWFRYPTDDGFAGATRRCIGIGRCLKTASGTMCPSYMVTREEKHSTRGRARLLFEMLDKGVAGGHEQPVAGGREPTVGGGRKPTVGGRREPTVGEWREPTVGGRREPTVGERREPTLSDGWRSKAVREALDLCLACKACKSECPAQVDMATYKSEFMAHHYAGRLRPRQAYAFGLVHWWLGLGSYMPRLAHMLVGDGPVARLAKWLARVDRRREIPRIASSPFTRSAAAGHGFAEATLTDPANTFPTSHANAGSADSAGTRLPGTVMLWPDTFNNYLEPHILEAASKLLRAAGQAVMLPPGRICCGRPLYDVGMLGLAKRQLAGLLETVGPAVRRGVPLVGLEPSCVATLRDELLNLFPTDDLAQLVASRTYLLQELLHESGWTPHRRTGRVLLHGHCHERSVLHFAATERLLTAAGLEVDVVDSGCCGMAGAFGFEQAKYEVSVACAERVLLPAIRESSPDTLIVTSGFSCREQVRQLTDRSPLHPIEILAAPA